MPRASLRPNLENVKQTYQRTRITGVTYMPLAMKEMKRLIKLRESPYQYSTNLKRPSLSSMKIMLEIGQALKSHMFKHNKTLRIKSQYMMKGQLASVNLSLNRVLEIRNVSQRNKTQPSSRTKHLSQCLKVVLETRKRTMKMTAAHKKTVFWVFKRNPLI